MWNLREPSFEALQWSRWPTGLESYLVTLLCMRTCVNLQTVEPRDIRGSKYRALQLRGAWLLAKAAPARDTLISWGIWHNHEYIGIHAPSSVAIFWLTKYCTRLLALIPLGYSKSSAQDNSTSHWVRYTIIVPSAASQWNVFEHIFGSIVQSDALPFPLASCLVAHGGMVPAHIYLLCVARIFHPKYASRSMERVVNIFHAFTEYRL